MSMKSWLRRVAFSALAAPLLGGSLVAPASAAGGGAPDVKVCFTYQTYGVYSNLPILLYRWDGYTWVYTGRQQKSGSLGCTVFTDVQAGRYFAGRALYSWYAGEWRKFDAWTYNYVLAHANWWDPQFRIDGDVPGWVRQQQ